MSSGHTILVVEDDRAIRRGLVDALRHEGFAVLEAADAAAGLEAAAGCDLVLLDVLLPKGDGFTVLRAVRAARPTLPVIMLTARGDESDRVKGLQLGADDYVVKPFSVKELLARVRAVLRRSPQRAGEVRSIRLAGGAEADLLRREVRFAGGAAAALTEREAEVLTYLAAHRGRAVSREELLRSVWRIDPTGAETRTVDMLIARLRATLRDEGAVATVRGKGYALAADAVVVGGGA